MLRRLLQNDILGNLAFLLVLAMGVLSYLQMPREEDPTVNLNWVFVFTALAGASATDVEERVTEPLEDAIARVSDIKFITSTTLEGASNILVRFTDLDETDFDKRLSDIRREIQNAWGDLPDDAEQPRVLEINSSNTLPAAIVLVSSRANDTNLQAQALIAEQDLERLQGVERVDPEGYREPELHVLFDPAKLVGIGVSPSQVADTVSAYFRDLAAGSVQQGDQQWLIRLVGTNSNPDYLANIPIVSAQGEVPLRSIADVERGLEDATKRIQQDGNPVVMLNVFKNANANILDLVQRINHYIAERNRLSATTGVTLSLLDDQTAVTRNALNVMQYNAALGLGLVLLVTWLFLGFKIALFTSLGIPFILAGTFWFLSAIGQTLNVTVLLGIVISLGMLVDDAVVVVEAIYYRLQHGVQALQAAIDALQEVFAPVATSVLTTIAAFLPLMLMPGILGQFMMVVPLVVTCALIISLIEAFWLLPSHVVLARVDLRYPSKIQRIRNAVLKWLRNRYTFELIAVLRRPKRTLVALGLVFAAALGALASGIIRVDFFASDSIRLFYVDVEMPAGTSLDKTLDTVLKIEKTIAADFRPGEVRAKAAYAGMRFTEREVLLGEQQGQIFVSLNPQSEGLRTVDEMIESLRPLVAMIPGPSSVSFLTRKKGPPTAKPISVKVRGTDIAEIRKASDLLKAELRAMTAVSDITDDDLQGRMVLDVRLDPDTLTRLGLDPIAVVRAVRLFADGEIVATMQDRGERLDVRVRARTETLQDIDAFLNNTIGLANGDEVALGQLLRYEKTRSQGNIRHYNLRRTITVEANLDKTRMDTVSVNRAIERLWNEKYAADFPNIDLDQSGELDDIEESINAIAILFVFGLSLIYLILGTQFKSYLQPLLILTTVPMAFTGVIFGLLLSGNPLSLYTLYGIVALAGIAVNSAIVLITTANRRLAAGVSPQLAIVYAAKRRIMPILITSLTTIAGLLSLALGLGGASLMWGPVATSIVWGLGFSTVLTLFLIPLLYSLFIRQADSEEVSLPTLTTLEAKFSVRGLLRRALRRLLFMRSPASAQDTDQVRDTEDLKILYESGVAALRSQDFEAAIRHLEKAAKLQPSNKLLNLTAAQALIAFMQQYGWDIGYNARALRYLSRARNIDKNDPRLIRLQKAYEQLQHTIDDEGLS